MSAAIFSLLLVLLAPSARSEETEQLLCPVADLSAGRWSEGKREATPREASRIAASRWREAERAPSDAELDPDWFDRFDSCLKVSGQPFSSMVSDPQAFRRVISRTLRDNHEQLENLSLVTDVDDEIKSYQRRAIRAMELAPALREDEKFKRALARAQDFRELSETGKQSAAAEKESCEGVNLSAELGPVRDQEDIGWCYAYTSADLATQHARKKGIDFRASAADIAFRYIRDHKSKEPGVPGLPVATMRGGGPRKALTAMIAAGFCSEKDSPSQDFAFGTIKETVTEIESFHKAALAGRPGDPCHELARTRALFPGIPFEVFAEALHRLGQGPHEFFDALSASNCEGKRNSLGLDPGQVKFFSAGDAQERAAGVMGAIDAQLSKGSASGITVKYSLLIPGQEGVHTLTVAGRKYEGGACRYLLRNSWGPGCHAKIREGMCAKDYPGHLWVSKGQLMRHLLEGYYIE